MPVYQVTIVNTTTVVVADNEEEAMEYALASLTTDAIYEVIELEGEEIPGLLNT